MDSPIARREKYAILSLALATDGLWFVFQLSQTHLTSASSIPLVLFYG
ncbi:MAG: hypothetical protein GY822_01275 [Deltaproteobacteria bacterium]|nr:hypothetical protein [Deltaproteobacteria bacterium]